MLRLSASLCWCATVVAQGQIFVVDANNGPGTNYTNIQTAVLAVPSGSILLVRPGTYPAVLVDGKGLTILGDTGVLITTAQPSLPFLEVRNTQANQTVTVRGLRPASASSMIVANAAGPVTLDGAGAQVTSGAGGVPVLAVASSLQVDVRNWWWQAETSAPAASVVNSVVVFERCTLVGHDGWFMFKAIGGHGTPALTVTTSQVQLVHTVARGGNGALFVGMGSPSLCQGAAAVWMTASTLRAIGLVTHALQGGTTPTVGQLPAITGNGTARVDPLIPMAAMPSAGIVLTRPTMPSLLAESALPGGVVTIQRFGAPGVLCAVLISLRAPSTSLPGFVDPVWLDAQSLVVEAVGPTPASGAFTVQKPVPNQPALRGFQFVCQAADLTAAGLVDISNPSPCFVR